MKTREDWHYWDGPISGTLRNDDTWRWFCLRNDDAATMYPTAPEGRLYDVWDLDGEPTDDDITDAWWTPGRPPDGSITEDEVLSYSSA